MPAQYYTDIVPGGVYAQGGKWQGNGIDIFAPRGTPVKAPFSGIVRYGNIPAPGAPSGTVPTVFLQMDDGISIEIGHVEGVKTGRVAKGDTIGQIGDSNLYPAWQHADFVINPSGPFSGGIDARQWLQSIGANLRQVAGRSRGPMEMLQGQSPFDGMAVGNSPGGNYGLLGLQNASILGQSETNPDSSGAATLIQDIAQEQFTPATNTIDFKNPFEGIPEAWADLLPFAVAAVIVAVGVGVIEQAESVGGTHSAAWMLAALIILGVFVYRNNLAGQIAVFLRDLAPALTNAMKTPQLATANVSAPIPQSNSVATSTFVPAQPPNNTATGDATRLGSIIQAVGWGGIFGGRAASVQFPYHGTPYNYNGQTVHQGVDLVPAGLNSPNGSPVASVVTGHVVAILSPAQARTTGVGVIIQDTQGLFHHFYHLAGSALRQGQDIQRGETIGTFGGDNHVHYEVRTTASVGGSTFDPTRWLQGTR